MKDKFSEFPQSTSPHMQTMAKCMSICASCSKKCIEEGHVQSALSTEFCSDVCGLAIKSASLESEFNHEMMELCAQVCKHCAEECQKMDVEHCKECAEICKECSEVCMANA